MTEKDTAIWMANKALEVPNADPDDELRTKQLGNNSKRIMIYDPTIFLQHMARD